MKFKKTFLFAILLLYLSASAQSRTDEQMAIDFSVDTLDGKIYSLEDFKGRNLIVVFWSTSCPICQKDLPKLNDLLKNLQTNVQVLAITAENETKVSKFLKSNPLNFIIGINGLDVILRYAKKNSRGEFILNYPYYVLINPQGGIILDNKLWCGIDGIAGEIGHITVEPMGVSCGCGSRGCLEQYSSASAIIRMTKELRVDYPESTLYSRLFFSAKDVYEAGKKGDRLALKVFEQMGFYLGIGLAGLINVLNPEAIVIGGGASKGWELFIPHTIEQIHKRAYREPARRAKLLKAELADIAGVLGVAKIAFDRIKASKTQETQSAV